LKLKYFILFPPVAIVLALAGLVAITVTGGLGGAIVYGPDADPFFKLVYHFIVGS